MSLDAARMAPLLAPRSIAFVGASTRADTPGNDMMRMIRRGGFTGTVYAVNPGAREVEGFACVPHLADLPASPDLTVLALRNDRLEEGLADAIAAGTKAAVIFASAQLPDERETPLAQRLAQMARAAGIAVCGPNCMGFYNDLDGVWVCGFPSSRQRAPGGIALVAHSGSVFGALAHNDPRLKFALAVSPGGEATATVADYIAYAVSRPEVKVIGLFLEVARDPRGFCAALELAARRGVPVVVLKVGRTQAAAAAALTHSGAMAGNDLAYEALFERHGVIRVETLDELAATLLLLSCGRRPGAGGLVAIGDSGGERELLIDLAERTGVPFSPINEATKASLAVRLEPGLEASNPLDAWGTGSDFVPLFTGCLGDLLADPHAALGLLNADLRDGYYLHRGLADAVLAASAACTKPVAVVTNYTQVRHDNIALELTTAGVPVLDGTLNALTAVRGAFAFRDFLARPVDPTPALVASARDRLRGRHGPRDEVESLSLLAAYGIPVVRHVIAETPAAVRAAATTLGYPVACKTAEEGVLHKSDAGGVKLGLADEGALMAAYSGLASRLGPRVVVAAMAERGVELALGMVRDAQFGSVVTIGAGGTLVELLDDRRASLAPFGPLTARRLLDALKVRPLLDGYRGMRAVDLGRLCDVIARFSVLTHDLADVVLEMDINPLTCGAEILAVDALVVLEPEKR